MARKYTHSQAFLEKQRLKQEAKAVEKLNKLDFRRNDTYEKIRQAIKEFIGGVVFDPHKKKEFENIMTNKNVFKKLIKGAKAIGAKTLEEFAISITTNLGLSNLQAETLAININETYIKPIKSMVSAGTLQDLKQMTLRDNLTNDIKNIMCKYSNSLEDFYAFELTTLDILGLSGKWQAIQAVIDIYDTWDEMFES